MTKSQKEARLAKTGARHIRQESAQGILVAALGVLAKHYGIRD
jgi:hypothetical protein